MGSEVVKEDGDLEGVLEAEVSDVSVKRKRHGYWGFVAASLRIQREFEVVQVFASGSECSDTLLYLRQREGVGGGNNGPK